MFDTRIFFTYHKKLWNCKQNLDQINEAIQQVIN